MDAKLGGNFNAVERSPKLRDATGNIEDKQIMGKRHREIMGKPWKPSKFGVFATFSDPADYHFHGKSNEICCDPPLHGSCIVSHHAVHIPIFNCLQKSINVWSMLGQCLIHQFLFFLGVVPHFQTT